MSAALLALREGVVRLLAEGGEPRLAELCAGAEVELLGQTQTWTVGERRVLAQSIVMALAPEELVELRRRPDGVSVVREAFATALRSPTTELAELFVIVRLPVVDSTWQRIYRQAPARPTPDRPEPMAVLEAAADLLRALGEPVAAAMLDRAELEIVPVPSSPDVVISHGVVRLVPADLAMAQRDELLADRIRRAVADAATRAVERVSEIELRARVGGSP
jgi:hypothetical protein